MVSKGVEANKRKEESRSCTIWGLENITEQKIETENPQHPTIE